MCKFLLVSSVKSQITLSFEFINVDIAYFYFYICFDPVHLLSLVKKKKKFFQNAALDFCKKQVTSNNNKNPQRSKKTKKTQINKLIFSFTSRGHTTQLQPNLSESFRNTSTSLLGAIIMAVGSSWYLQTWLYVSSRFNFGR